MHPTGMHSCYFIITGCSLLGVNICPYCFEQHVLDGQLKTFIGEQ